MKVYIYDIASLRNEDIDRYYHRLPKWRRDKLDKCSVVQDKLRCLGASMLLIYGLKKEGVNLSDCQIIYGENGKPYIGDREDLYFNISHSGTKVVVGIGDEPLGVDVQQIRSVNLRMVDRFFTDKEGEYVNNEIIRFHEIWCLKESYLKCIGTGLTKSLKDVEIIPGYKMEMEGYELQLENLEGYKLGICTSKNTNIEIYNLDNIKI